MKSYNNIIITIFCCFIISTISQAYPIDGYTKTGIRRLLRLERIFKGEIKDKLPVKGALLPSDSIFLNLVHNQKSDFPNIDPQLQSDVNRLFPNLDESYSIAIMDITDPENPKYAEKKSTRQFQPGSVGKLAVVTALFCELENLYPDNFDLRISLLKNKVVKAGIWAIPNIHTVPFFNPDNNKLEKRLLRESDEFTLYEWVDHMLSVSSNGAASVVWREVMLMREYGQKYPELNEAEAAAYWKTAKRKDISNLSIDVINTPLRDLNISEDEFRVGTLFTRGASNIVPPQGGSVGTPAGLIKWLWALEHGQVIDENSSLEIKKMLYMTDRRIRYASNNALKNCAVYFKSGSLYSCKSEENYTCEKYKGNSKNFMNSVAIVESPDSLKYMVVLMTNVLKKNSNNDHNALAGQIHQIIKKSHKLD